MFWLKDDDDDKKLKTRLISLILSSSPQPKNGVTTFYNGSKHCYCFGVAGAAIAAAAATVAVLVGCLAYQDIKCIIFERQRKTKKSEQTICKTYCRRQQQQQKTAIYVVHVQNVAQKWIVVHSNRIVPIEFRTMLHTVTINWTEWNGKIDVY